jgi:1-acyl-sn-glycerol-3-phosphate acyltransferase
MTIDTPESPTDPRDRKRYYYETTFFRQVFTGVIRQAFKALAVIHVSGLHHLPLQGPVVLAGNHVTNFDVFPMQLVLPRPIFFMAKAELHQNPLVDAMLRRLGAFPVQRGARDEWSYNHALSVLKHEQMLGIFPEGKRNRARGLLPAKTGAARMAITTASPVVPVALNGTQSMFRNFPHRTHINVTLGKVIYPEADDTPLSLTDRLMFALADLLPPEQRGVYRERPDWL